MNSIMEVRDELCTVRSFITCASDAADSPTCESKAIVPVLESVIDRLRKIDAALEVIASASAVRS